MDLFILDSQFRRTAVIDQFESLIWTERFNSVGDFELNIASSLNARNLLVPDTKLAIAQSTRVMNIETVVDKKDDEGRVLLNIKGPSLESILADRVARHIGITNPDNDPTDLKWYFTNQLPAAVIRAIFKYVVVDKTISAGDGIPYYTTGSVYPASTIPEPNTLVTLNVSPSTLLDAIAGLCQIYDLGFRLMRNGDNSQLMFEIYSGNDRTTVQNVLAPVIFAPELDNLSDVSYLTAIGNYKNVADVVSPDGQTTVYAANIDASIAGFERKTLFVDASSIRYPDRSQLIPKPYTISDDQAKSIKTAQQLTTTTQDQSDSLAKLTQMKRLYDVDIANIAAVIQVATTANPATLTTQQVADINAVKNMTVAYNPTEDAALQTLLVQKGREELAKNTNLAAFDGSIPKNSQFVYGRDYELGDLVEIRNSDQATNQMRVTEQIFSSDATGDTSYPTLSLKQLITRGSWYAEPTAEVWDDLVDVNDTWASRP